MHARIRIILAEDHHVVRNGIKSLLEMEDDFEVVGEAANGIEALQLLDEGIEADVVLSDISMPDMDGLELARKLATQYPHIKVIILSMMDNENYVYDAVKSGIKGYLLKNTGRDELVFSIRHVAGGNQVICSELGMQMLWKAMEAHTQPVPKPYKDFSPRELEVLLLTADGYTNNEIAEKLFTSRRTVEGHRQSLIDKAGVKNTPHLIQFAFRTGILK
jgi:DNA-binding NarL/FixJ family response regulator